MWHTCPCTMSFHDNVLLAWTETWYFWVSLDESSSPPLPVTNARPWAQKDGSHRTAVLHEPCGSSSEIKWLDDTMWWRWRIPVPRPPRPSSLLQCRKQPTNRGCVTNNTLSNSNPGCYILLTNLVNPIERAHKVFELCSFWCLRFYDLGLSEYCPLSYITRRSVAGIYWLAAIGNKLQYLSCFCVARCSYLSIWDMLVPTSHPPHDSTYLG